MTRATSLTLGEASRPGLMVAVLLAGITGVLVFLALNSASSDEEQVRDMAGGAETAVVTAKEDIPARTEIKASMLEIARVPENALLPGALASNDLVVGRVSRVPVYRGEQLLQEKLATQKTDLGLSYIVPAGRRAMAVKVDKVIGAGGLIRPGDRVDVAAVVDITYRSLTTDREFHDTRSLLLAQDIEVLAVEQKLENVARSTTDGKGTTGAAPVDQPEPQPSGTVVTLSLSPAEVQEILLSEDKGKIRLAVRAPGDTEVVEQSDVTFLSLVDPAFQKLIQEALKTPTR